jgi:rubrerythrin
VSVHERPPEPTAAAAFDPSGALEETYHRAFGRTRRQALGRAGAVALGATVVLAGSRAAGADGLSGGDVDILNYALTLEHLQAAFYAEAERRGALRGQAARAAGQIGAVERAHVKAFQELLGRRAVAAPFFDFRGVTEDPAAFLRTAVAFEDLAVSAYKGQATRIQARSVLAAALAIHSVEARHAAWIRYLNGVLPASRALDEPLSRRQVDLLVRSTGFVSGRPRTRASGPPSFTG